MLTKEIHDLVQSLPEAYFFISATGEIIDANPAAAGMLGRDFSSLPGQRVAELVADPADKIVRYLRLWSRNRNPIPGSLSWRKSNETIVEYRCSGYLLQAGTQSSPALVVMRCEPKTSASAKFLSLNKTLEELRASYHKLAAQSGLLTSEITERNRAEEALRESETRYRRITDAITDYIYTVRVDGGRAVETRHGSGCHAVTGYTAEEFAADPYLWISMVAPEDRTAVENQARRVLSGVEAPAVEHRLIRKDGLQRWVRNTIVPRFDPQGRLWSYDGLIQDITERKRGEEALRKSEKIIRDITSSLGEGLYVLNDHGEVTFMNPEAEHLLGWTETELLSRNIHDVVHNRKPDGAPLSFEECRMHKVISTGARFSSQDELFIRRDGTVFPVAVISAPLLEKGKIIATVTAFRDISEMKHAEQERENLITQLQKALAEIKTLHGILPICSSCKKIRDDKGSWTQMEAYISEHTDAEFSHGLCSECAKKLYPKYYKE